VEILHIFAKVSKDLPDNVTPVSRVKKYLGGTAGNRKGHPEGWPKLLTERSNSETQAMMMES
jgi:hypothetical protein